MKTLLEQRATEPAAPAVALFCYQLRKHRASRLRLGGIDLLVFTGVSASGRPGGGSALA
jgi:acetate kinase